MDDINSLYPHGSADWADEDEIAAAGYFNRSPDALLIGFMGDRALWHSGLGGVILCAGGRGGKMQTWLAFAACGVGCEDHNVIQLDIKGEMTCLGEGQ